MVDYGFKIRSYHSLLKCCKNTKAIREMASQVALVVKNLPANARDEGSIPGSGRSPGEGNGSPLQCSCWENPRDGGAWRATVPGVVKSWTQLSNGALTR